MSGIKFMGKDPNGLAKAISVVEDNNGNGVMRIVDAAPHAYDELDDTIKVKSQMSDAISEDILMQQKKIVTLLEVLTNTTALYDNGIERAVFDKGRMTPSNDITKANATKELTHLNLIADNSTGTALATFVTLQKIDVTNLRVIKVEWEAICSNHTNNHQSYIDLVTDRNADYFNGVKQFRKNGSFAKREDTLDVSNLTGEYYVRVMAHDAASAIRADVNLKVYKIWKEV